MEQILALLQPLFEAYAASLGAKVLSVIGALHLIVPPAQGIWEKIKAFVKATPSEADDKIVEEVEASKAWKYAAILVKWLVGLKLK